MFKLLLRNLFSHKCNIILKKNNYITCLPRTYSNYCDNQTILRFNTTSNLLAAHNYSSFRKIFKKRKGKKLSYDIVGIDEATTSTHRTVSAHIPKPEYAESGVVSEHAGESIELKNDIQINAMKQSCMLAKKILLSVGELVQVGRTTDELDFVVHHMCENFGAYPSPLNYRGFPKSVCTSVNNIACHGIPDMRKLKDGDIITIDVSVFFQGYHGDCAATFAVGNIDEGASNLMAIAKKCLKEAISICAPNRPLSDIGKTISAVAEAQNFSVIPAFCGHGIGSYFHGPPSVLHYRNDDHRLMKEGMVFTIEPVICEGEPDIVVLEDSWTAATEDNSRCAQYEDTVLITKDGVEILTVLPNEENFKVQI